MNAALLHTEGPEDVEHPVHEGSGPAQVKQALGHGVLAHQGRQVVLGHPAAGLDGRVGQLGVVLPRLGVEHGGGDVGVGAGDGVHVGGEGVL